LELDGHHWRKIQALQDFQHALSAISFFAEIPHRNSQIERRRFRCYQDYAVICYCRPFTNSSGLPKLSLRQLGIKPTQGERELHELLLDYRNKVVAHTDADRMRLLLTSFEVNPGVNFPQIAEDEGFVLLEKVDAVEAWLVKVMRPLAIEVFDLVQKLPAGTRNLRDYLRE
jgi:hypothetical protein